MARRVKFYWRVSEREFEAIRRRPAMRSRLYSEAVKMADAAGRGYIARGSEGRSRSRAAVITATVPAMRSNAKRNTLVRVLNAARRA